MTTWHAADILAALCAINWQGHNELSVGDLRWLAGELERRFEMRVARTR